MVRELRRGGGLGRGGLGRRRKSNAPLPLRSLSLSLASLSLSSPNQKKKLPLTSQSSQYAASGAAMAAALAMAAAAAAAGPRASEWFDADDGSLSLLAPPGLAEYGSFDLALCDKNAWHAYRISCKVERELLVSDREHGRAMGKRHQVFFFSTLSLLLRSSDFSTYHPRLPLLISLGLPSRHALLEGRKLVRGGAVGRHFFFLADRKKERERKEREKKRS